MMFEAECKNHSYWQMGGKNLKSVNHDKYRGAVPNPELSDDKDIQRQLR